MRCWPGLLRTTIAERTARFPEYAEILKGQLCAVTHTYCLQYVSPTSFQKECVNPKLNLHTSDAAIAASPALALDIMNSCYSPNKACFEGFLLIFYRITHVFQDLPSSAWVPKPRYLPLCSRICLRQPRYLSLGT
jgi:hypothetical protein